MRLQKYKMLHRMLKPRRKLNGHYRISHLTGQEFLPPIGQFDEGEDEDQATNGPTSASASLPALVVAQPSEVHSAETQAEVESCYESGACQKPTTSLHSTIVQAPLRRPRHATPLDFTSHHLIASLHTT